MNQDFLKLNSIFALILYLKTKTGKKNQNTII